MDATEERAVVDVLRSGWLSMGPRTLEFENRFCSYVGSRFAIATSSCTSALHLAVLAAGIGQGDEVVVPSLSFVATANAVAYAGAKPIFADVDSLQRPVLSVDDVVRLITPKTRAIIAMHYGGYPCDMRLLVEVAQAHGLRVIEDAAHALGSRVAGRSCGTIGDFGCFSFFGNKNLPAGEGGMLVTNDERLYERAKIRRSHGMTALSWDRYSGHSFSYDVVDLGFNFRMPELTAAVGLAQLTKLETHNRRRNELFEEYLAHLGGYRRLLVPFRDEPCPGARHLFPIVLPEGVDRASFMEKLRQQRIQTSIHYPPIHRFTLYRKNAAVVLPITEHYASRVVTLPFHPGLTRNDIGVICEAVTSTLASY